MATQSDTPHDTDDDGSGVHPMLEAFRHLDRSSGRQRMLQGLSLPLRSARLIATHPSLWPHVVVPALINLALFVGATFLFVSYSGTIVGWLWTAPPVDQWYDWVYRFGWYLLVAVVAILSIGAAYVLTLLAGAIVASPFNEFLSMNTEKILLNRDELPERDESVAWGVLRGIGSSIFVLGSYCVVMLPVLLLNLVPGVGQFVASLVGTVVSAMFLALEYSDAPLDRRGRGLREKFELLEGDRALTFGYGFGTTLVLWVPFVNFATIPIAVVGGTALGIVLDEWERGNDEISIGGKM